jgi:hypothetical protein
MTPLDSLYNAIMNFFLNKKEPVIDPFIENLKAKGFEFDVEREGWSRVWSTNNEQETCLEIYQQDEDNNTWKVIMIGDNGDVFYEHPVQQTNDAN